MNRYSTLRLGRAGLSFLVDQKALFTILTLAAASVSVALLSLTVGEYPLSLRQVISALLGLGEGRQRLIVVQFRLPRILIGWIVGAALGVSGALLQGIVRNPLASPDILGITGGASVAAVTTLVLIPGVSSAILAPVAFIGAGVTALMMYLLAYKRGFSPLRLVLVGVGIGGAARSLTTLLIVISPMYQASRALLWLTGSVYGASWREVTVIAPWVVFLLPAAFLLGRGVDAMQLGQDVHASLGGSVNRDAAVVTAVSVALAGTSVSVAGGIGFVGLMAPHMARLLVGPLLQRLLPAAALLGAILVTSADFVGRTGFGTLDLPAGIFTAALGAPFFILLLYRSRQTL